MTTHDKVKLPCLTIKPNTQHTEEKDSSRISVTFVTHFIHLFMGILLLCKLKYKQMSQWKKIDSLSKRFA